MKQLRRGTRDLRRPALTVACGLMLMVTLAGCQVVGAVAHVMGPPPVQASYAPPRTPMLVLAENYTDPSAASLEAEQLERFVMEELKAHDVAPLAEYEKVYELRAAHPQRFRSMPIDQLGRLAGAQQVLYISLQTSTTEVGQASDVLQGRGSARVRVVDVGSGQTVWPTEGSDGVSVWQDSPLVSAGNGVNDASVRREIQRALAHQIARLFYKHRPEN